MVTYDFGNKMYTDMILIDQKNAYVESKHKNLFEKVIPLGFPKNTISWSKAYINLLYNILYSNVNMQKLHLVFHKVQF